MGLFITFEGPDGSGKSTQAHLLGESLRSAGHSVTETREPGGTAVGERVRALLLDPDAPQATPLVMALLLSASRSQLVAEVIRPALAGGKTVIADRYAESTVAYQSFGFGLDRRVIGQLTAIATEGLRPDRIVYVDVPPHVGLSRSAARGGRNRLDAASLDFHERVRTGYLELMSEEPDRWVRVDGTRSVECVHRAILDGLQPVLGTVGSRT